MGAHRPTHALAPVENKAFPRRAISLLTGYCGKVEPCDLLLSLEGARRFAEVNAHTLMKSASTLMEATKLASPPFHESELALQFRPATDHDLPARFCRLLPRRKDRIFADLPTAPGFGPLAPELYFTGCAVAHTSPYLVAGAHRRFPGALRGSMAEQCADLDDSVLVHQQLL